MTDQQPPKPLFDRLATHVAIFQKVAARNLAAPYEEVQARGREAAALAADLIEAMEFIQTHEGASADGSR